MQNSLFQAICHMGIFMICVRAVIQFRPSEAYEKYLRLLASIMIMIQLFLPVGRFILGRGGQEAADILQQFKWELEQGMEDAAESAAAADALMEQMTLEEVQRRLEEASPEEADSWSRMDEGVESGLESGMDGGVESGLESGMDRDGESGSGSRTDQDGEPGQENSMSRDGDTSSWDSGQTAIQIEEIESVLIEPVIP